MKPKLTVSKKKSIYSLPSKWKQDVISKTNKKLIWILLWGISPQILEIKLHNSDLASLPLFFPLSIFLREQTKNFWKKKNLCPFFNADNLIFGRPEEQWVHANLRDKDLEGSELMCQAYFLVGGSPGKMFLKLFLTLI